MGSDTAEANGNGRPAAEGSPYKRHIPALDGVRGIAALGVMASHLFEGAAMTPMAKHVQAVARTGAIGVGLFFALSGFLITGILYDSLGEARFFRKFYARRALRIFPLYYGVVAVFAVASLWAHWQPRELISLALYLQNTWLVAAPIGVYSPAAHLPLDHFWSLAIEEQFYFVWPLLVFLLRKRRRVLWACIAGALFSVVLRCVLVAHGTDLADVHEMTACTLDSLLGGGALAMLLRGRWHDRVLRLSPWLLAGCVVVVIALPRLGFWSTSAGSVAVLSSLGTFLFAGIWVGLLGVVLRRGGVGERMFSMRWLRMTGKYSYGLYVLHRILAAYLLTPVRLLFVPVLHSKALAGGAGGIVVGLLSFAAAWVSYQAYEKQFLKLKRFFDYRPHGGATAG